MKKLLFALMSLVLFSCTNTEKYERRIESLQDSLFLSQSVITTQQQIIIVQDSAIYEKDSIIESLESRIMSKSQFIELYKFKRLERYYQICKNRPDYWKYYKGWSVRVFELQNKNYKPTDWVPNIE